MQEFRIIDEKRYPLTVSNFNNIDNLPYFRFEHRVTIGYRGRRLIALVDQLKGTISIEEITMGKIAVIEDELFAAAYNWIESRGFLNMLPPLWKPAGYNKLMQSRK